LYIKIVYKIKHWKTSGGLGGYISHQFENAASTCVRTRNHNMKGRPLMNQKSIDDDSRHMYGLRVGAVYKETP